MGIQKKEMEKKDEDRRKTGIFCSRCKNEINENELNTNESINLCAECRAEQIRTNKE